MSITSNFPAIKPTLLLDFANTKQLDPRITFTRASTATYYGTQTAKAEENLLTYSQEFDNAAWVKTTATVTANSFAAPDGTTTADTLTATNTNATLLQTFTATATAYTFSVYIYRKTGTGNVDITVDGTTYATQSITGAWVRYSVTTTPTAGSKTAGIRLVTNGDEVYIWGAQLEQRSAVSSYTVTTTQTITNYIPQLLTAASGVARFDNNPTTFESLGLLIEESRTNLILQSEDLDTTWTETRATLSLNSVVAPNGALTADRLIASTDNNTHFSSQTFTGTAASHTFTVYAKASGLNHVALRLFNGTSQVGLAYYNLSTGATGTVTAGTAAITSVGNGYYRCSLTATLAASASCTADIQLANADNTNSFIGNAFDGVTLWGTQVELGAFATSYIPTVASQVTRAADAASMTGTNFSAWYNAAEGSLYAEASVFALTTDAVIASINRGNTNNEMRLRALSSSNTLAFRVFAEGVSQASLTAANTLTVNQPFKEAGAYKVNDFAFSANAGTVLTDTVGIVPTVDSLQLGGLLTVSILNGTIRKVAYYPLRVTNAQLQALTS